MSNSKVTDFYDDYYRSVEVLDELMRRWKAGMKASDVSAAHAMLADYNDLLRQLMKGPPELFEKFSQFVRKQRSTIKPSRSLARLSASCTPTR